MTTTRITITEAEIDAHVEALHTFEGIRYLWPVQCCSRCGGGGEYSWNQMTGSKCFKCQGTGCVAIKAVASIVAEYRSAEHKVGHALVIGDEVLDTLAYRAEGGEHWVTVTDVALTDDSCGSDTTDGVTTVHYQAWVTTSDGERHLVGATIVRTRRRKADYVARADEAARPFARRELRKIKASS